MNSRLHVDSIDDALNVAVKESISFRMFRLWSRHQHNKNIAFLSATLGDFSVLTIPHNYLITDEQYAYTLMSGEMELDMQNVEIPRLNVSSRYATHYIYISLHITSQW